MRDRNGNPFGEARKQKIEMKSATRRDTHKKKHHTIYMVLVDYFSALASLASLSFSRQTLASSL